MLGARGKRASTSSAADSQGGGLAISCSFFNKYNMKKLHGYSWAPSKCLLKHKCERLRRNKSNGLTAAF